MQKKYRQYKNVCDTHLVCVCFLVLLEAMQKIQLIRQRTFTDTCNIRESDILRCSNCNMNFTICTTKSNSSFDTILVGT